LINLVAVYPSIIGIVKSMKMYFIRISDSSSISKYYRFHFTTIFTASSPL
jgi:hypothetical protein